MAASGGVDIGAARAGAVARISGGPTPYTFGGRSRAFGSEPGRTVGLQKQVKNSPNMKVRAERQEARQDQREAREKRPGREVLLPGRNRQGQPVGFKGVETRTGAVRGGGGYAA